MENGLGGGQNLGVEGWQGEGEVRKKGRGVLSCFSYWDF